MLILSLDPSLTRLGWATFNLSSPSTGATWEGFDLLQSPNWNFGTFIPGAAMEGEDSKSGKFLAVRNFFQKKTYPDELVYEMPSFFSSVEGRVAAKQGYTTDLGIVIGIAIGVYSNSKIYPYTVGTWKGSVSKDITRKKFNRIFRDGSQYELPHDAVDAIMILRYHLHEVYNVK